MLRLQRTRCDIHKRSGYGVITSACSPTEARGKYTADLLGIDSCRPVRRPVLPSEIKIVRTCTPLKVQEWGEMLAGHPDETFAQYVLSGLLGGFRIGFNYRHHVCTSSNTNMCSALSNPAVVADYFLEEVGQVASSLN